MTDWICATERALPWPPAAGISAPRQARVYVALLRLGGATPAQIAQQAEVKRPTAYEALEDLCARGLATRAVVGRRRSYTAAPRSQ